ncbi:MAG: Gfo/Idh/MocA family oxidoreductase [Bacteroidales bacterium]|jgi:predicted dehydrogenase|nr:Gfo/Idh/MocA family oxidoreductase [Bacteroidales bacterium]
MVKIGIAGTGHLGKIHIKCLKNISTAELVGFYEPDDTTAAEVANVFNIKRFDSFEDLLSAIDAVDIVSPTTAHYSLAMQAMSAGKHVFLEKPLTATLDESKNVVNFAKKQQLNVQVGHVERFNDAYLAAKPYFNNPLFVEAHRLSEFNPRGTDVSVVLDLMIHDIDLILSMIHSPVKHISASGVAVVSQMPDIANARIEFENGATANLTASRIALKKMRKMRIFQPGVYLTMDFIAKEACIMQIKDYQPSDDNDWLPLIIDLGENKGKKRIFIETPKNEPVNAIEMELSLFIDSILNNTTPVVSATDGHNALQIATKIMEQLQNLKIQ